MNHRRVIRQYRMRLEGMLNHFLATGRMLKAGERPRE
jgi:hypothetical protein